ncbi:glutamyl-tRNA reductase [bacterium]|nr:glutamyl-tRNA reductase [bacterium]
MRIETIGINHKTSSIEVRDKAALGPDRIGEALNHLLHCHNNEGAVILSTCNRTEIYLSPLHHGSDEKLRALLSDITSLSAEEVSSAYIFRDEEALNHLFRVSSGLDSQLLGEMQILAQLKSAYHTALDQATTNNILNKAFLRAIECGKEVRHRTAISQGAISVASAAVQLATKIFGTLEGHHVLLVGAGETARLATKYLAASGVKDWRVSNRTEANAKVVADLIGGRVTSFPPSEDDLAWADVVLSATSANEPVITQKVVKAGKKRRRSMQLFLDLAVPRDVESLVKNIGDTFLYTVDDFQEMVATNMKAREREAVRAEKIVQRTVEEFTEWYQENRVAPTIRQLQEVLESIRIAEVDRNVKRFKEADHDQVDRFSKALMRKVTNHFVANLKRSSLEEDDLSIAKAMTLALASDEDDQVNEVLEQLNHELSH